MEDPLHRSEHPGTWTQRLAAIVTLSLLSPILTEVVTGSTPGPAFLNPGTFSFLLIVGYGIPVLLLREWAVRFRLGAGGLFLLGLAYGIYNEGMWSKTMILGDHLPVAQFSRYGRLLGINVPWMASIALWHVLGAVLLPVVIVHDFFPAVRNARWLNTTLVVVLTLVLLVLASVAFLGPVRVKGTRTQLGVFLGLMALCVVMAAFLPKPRPRPKSSATVRPFLLGLGLFPVSMAAFALAGARVPVPIYLLVLALIVAGYSFLLTTRGWLTPPGFLLFGLGAYMQSALVPLLIGLATGRLDLSLTSIVFEIVFAVCAMVMIWRSRQGRYDGAGAQLP